MIDAPSDLKPGFQEVLKRAEEVISASEVVFYRVEVCIETPAGSQAVATWENSRYGVSKMGNICRRPQRKKGSN